jgi:hypothetical protein
MSQPSSSMHRKLERVHYLYRHGGMRGMLFYLFYRFVNSFTRLRVFRAVVLDASAPVEPQLGQLDNFQHGLVEPQELAPHVEDPEGDLSPEFLAYADVQGDTCYAVFDGDALVSYCWNSGKPTMVEDDLYIEFAPGYVYRYKEYTRPSHRGRRISSYARAESLRRFAAAGVKGFAGYVEADNFISYRALQRAGHLFPGFMVVLGRGPSPWIWHSPRAREWGFRVVAGSAGDTAYGLGESNLSPP